MSIFKIKNGVALLALAVLAACGGGGGGGPAAARVTGVADVQMLEGDSNGTLRFVVALDRTTTSDLRMTWSTASTGKGGAPTTGSATGGATCAAGVDFIAVNSTQLVIPSGSSSGEIQVTVCGDTTFEPTETVAVNWTSADASGTAIGTIVNDDAGGLNGTAVATSFGRDSNPLTNSDADGRLGFSFAAVPSATDFRCIRDKVTGLLWEGKTTAAGTHAAAATYTYANLAALVTAVNTEALCGFTDWRLPTPEELNSVVDAGTGTAPTVDTRWFSGQQAAPYWSATTYRDNTSANAWYVDFGTGTAAFDNKSKAYAARLVTRGGTTAPAALPASCTDSARFTDHGDGTVTDARSGLMWKKCAEGFAGASCTGTGSAFDWTAAVARPATVNADAAGAGLGYKDWRLATRAELSSITEREQCFNPAANTSTFVNTEPVGFWTATPYALNASLAWAVDFFDGQVGPGAKTGVGSANKRVRLVRAGQ